MTLKDKILDKAVKGITPQRAYKIAKTLTAISPKKAESLNRKLALKKLMVEAEQSQEPLPEPEPFYLLIDDIKGIKHSTYIYCDTTGDYSHLLIAGEPTDEHYKQAWDKLNYQRQDIIKDNGIGSYVKLSSRIQELAIHIANVQYVVAAFKVEYSELLAERLREMGYDKPYTPESYLDDLKYVENGIAILTIKVEELKREYDLKYPKEEAKKQTEDDYMNTLDDILTHRNSSMAATEAAEKWTEYDYCIALNKYIQYCNRLKDEAERRDAIHR